MNDIEILEKFKDDCLNIHEADIEGIQIGHAIENLIQRNKNLEEIEKEHKEENGRLREELEKYQSLLAKSTVDRVVTSIKDNKKTKEDLEMLNEGWKIKVKEIVDLYNNTSQCTKKYNEELANILCDLQELLEESEK